MIPSNSAFDLQLRDGGSSSSSRSPQRDRSQWSHRSRLEVWADIIRILSEHGPCSKAEIIRNDRSLQYKPFMEHLQNLVALQFLNLEVEIHSRSWRHRQQKYSVSEKGRQFYRIMQQMMELCQPVVQ